MAVMFMFEPSIQIEPATDGALVTFLVQAAYQSGWFDASH
jgi:hypothetical protein